MAMIDNDSPSIVILRWEYTAEYHETPDSQPLRHYGVTSLVFNVGLNGTKEPHEGKYYSEGSRNSHGTITLTTKKI
jgi:hypothetical protein